MPRKRRSPFTLTERDRQVLHALAVMRGVPLEILAYDLFLFDPFTGKRNSNPLRACERRLRELVRTELIPNLPAGDIVVRARRAAYAAPFTELHDQLRHSRERLTAMLETR